ELLVAARQLDITLAELLGIKAELVLGKATLGDVAHHTRERPTPLEVEGTDRQIHRKDLPVLAQAKYFPYARIDVGLPRPIDLFGVGSERLDVLARDLVG